MFPVTASPNNIDDRGFTEYIFQVARFSKMADSIRIPNDEEERRMTEAADTSVKRREEAKKREEEARKLENEELRKIGRAHV